MPVFGDAWLADTQHLTLEEGGAYWKLLIIAWRSEGCSLPNDDKRLAMMLGITPKKWARLKPVVMAFWSLDDGRWTQKRQLKERRFVEQKREKNTDAAHARWNKQPTENKGNEGCERISKRSSERTSERNAPPPTNKKPTVSTRARTIPDDWQPEPFSEGSQSRSIVDGWSAETLQGQVERFANHHRAKGSTFKDWQAAWSTWVLNSRQFSAAPSFQSKPGEPRPLHIVMTEERERRQAWERQQQAAAGR